MFLPYTAATPVVMTTGSGRFQSHRCVVPSLHLVYDERHWHNLWYQVSVAPLRCSFLTRRWSCPASNSPPLGFSRTAALFLPYTWNYGAALEQTYTQCFSRTAALFLPYTSKKGRDLFDNCFGGFSRTAALFLPYTTLLPSTSGCNHVGARCRLRAANPMHCRPFGHGAGSYRPTFRKPRLTPAPKSPFPSPARWLSPDRSSTCRSWPASQTLRPIPPKPRFAKTASATPANLLRLLGARTPREAPSAQIFANLPAADPVLAICEPPARVSP